MKSAKAILTALFAVVGAVGASAETEVDSTRGETVSSPVRDTYPGTEVRTVPVVKEKLYVDSIGFGSGEPNWGGPFVIGHCGGRAISVGYDYNYLMHMVYADGEPILYDGTLSVEADSAANRAIFRRCGKTINIDFNKDDAVDRLVRFVEPPKGMTRERYTYVLGGKDNWCFDNRTTIVAELPTDSVAKSRVLEAILISYREGDFVLTDGISKDIDQACSSADTVYVMESQPVINSLYDYVCARAQYDRINGKNYSVPLPADSMSAPMAGFVQLVEYVPVLMTDKLLTINLVKNETYPAGGCRNSHTAYKTYVTQGDKTVRLTAKDIFRPEKYNDVKRAFIEYLSKSLGAANEPNADGSVWPEPYRIYECFSADNSTVFLESDDIVIKHIQEKMRNNDYTDVIMPDVALLPDGVMFTYDMSLLTDFGEDGAESQFVPYEALKGCFRPEMKKAKPKK